MKILHIIDSLASGGAEKLILDTVPLIVERGFEVDVLLLDGQRTPFYTELDSLKCCNIFSLGKSLFNPLNIFKIGRLLRRYDVVHVHLFPAQYFAVFSSIIYNSKAKLLFTEHNTTNSRLRNSLILPIERFIYKRYTFIVCITSAVKDVLKEKLDIPDEKLVVINNGIKYADIVSSHCSDRKSFGYATDDILLIMVAGFRQQKDHNTVFRAIRKLPSNYKLILVGDGERSTELLLLSKELEISDRVNFLGVRSDVPQLLKMSDLAVVSSHWEGFGLAAAEAMAAGIPVIASRVEGLSQVVEGGGILFEKGNDFELSNSIFHVMNDHLLYSNLAKSGLQKAYKYDIEKMIDSTIALYRNTRND